MRGLQVGVLRGYQQALVPEWRNQSQGLGVPPESGTVYGSDFQYPMGLSPHSRDFGMGHPAALLRKKVPSNGGRADRADEARNGRGPALEMVPTEDSPVVVVRAGVDGKEVAVRYLVWPTAKVLQHNNGSIAPEEGPGRRACFPASLRSAHKALVCSLPCAL